jgi:hypothetical protein
MIENQTGGPMSQNETLAKINQLNQMVIEGRALEAFERFYDEKIVMQENDGAPISGKAANREREKQFFGSIVEFRGAKVVSVAASGDKTYVEWFMDYTHKDWGKRAYNQVAVQTWKDGKITHEKFYYGA